MTVLRDHHEAQLAIRQQLGERWTDLGLVFPSQVGTAWDASNVRTVFRQALAGTPGIDPADWTPRELRHSFVSTLSDHGLPIEEIARLDGHSSTAVTERVYRHQIRPVVETGAEAMDDIFRSHG